MPRITTEMATEAYRFGELVYEQKIESGRAAQEVHENTGMNQNSATTYILNFQNMMCGKRSRRGMKQADAAYFIRSIAKNYGGTYANNAKKAVPWIVENERFQSLYPDINHL